MENTLIYKAASVWNDVSEYKYSFTYTLMIVIRQILEYYFIQMVGYQNADLRKDLLNKKDFSKEDYAAASAMIAMINVGATGFNDGLYYDSSAADLTHLRRVFEKIFIAMGQEQHYNMMMRRI